MYVIGLCCIGNNIPWGLSAHFYQPFLPPWPISQIDGLPYLFIVGCSSRVVGTSTRLSPPLFPTGRKEGGGKASPQTSGLELHRSGARVPASGRKAKLRGKAPTYPWRRGCRVLLFMQDSGDDEWWEDRRSGETSRR